MACESMRRPGETLEQRMARAKAAQKKLEAALLAGKVKVAIGPNGAVAFVGWAQADREDLTDSCTVRTLSAEGSWALKQAIAKAEAMSGRRVNMNAVAAGWHSHDDGRSFGPGHR